MRRMIMPTGGKAKKEETTGYRWMVNGGNKDGSSLFEKGALNYYCADEEDDHANWDHAMFEYNIGVACCNDAGEVHRPACDEDSTASATYMDAFAYCEMLNDAYDDFLDSQDGKGSKGGKSQDSKGTEGKSSGDAKGTDSKGTDGKGTESGDAKGTDSKGTDGKSSGDAKGTDSKGTDQTDGKGTDQTDGKGTDDQSPSSKEDQEANSKGKGGGRRLME